MTLELSHLAIACPKISDVLSKLQALALELESEKEVPTEKVRAAFVPVAVSADFRIELLEPTSKDSPISKFLEKRVSGGLHHISFEVDELDQWYSRLTREKIEVLPPGIRKAARGRALFIHPRSMGGVLVELEEIT